jgi:rhodanese-related sulfurtransferase
MKKQAKEIALLLGLTVALALCVNFFSPVGIALVGQWDISKGVITAGAKNGAVTGDLEIDDVKNARQIFNSGTALFVDARTRESYEEGHISGAVSFPLGEFDMHIDAFMKRHSPEKSIVTYCSGRTCEDSHELAQLFLASGFLNVRVFIDGFPGWEAEGYPIE